MRTEQAARLPDFIVAGVAKAGTTSLHDYLARSPRIDMPDRKEGRFLSQMPAPFHGPGSAEFNETIPSSLDEYIAGFEGCGEDALTGDISPDYFFYAESFAACIDRLYHRPPPVWVILREPVRRAHSHYLFMRQLGLETLPFLEALTAEKERAASGWPMGFQYLEASRYADRIGHLQKRLGARLQVIIYEDYQDAAAIAARITRQLGVNAPAEGPPVMQNESFVPRHRVLHELVHGEHAWKRPLKAMVAPSVWIQARRWWRKLTTERPQLDRAVAARLSAELASDRVELSRLLDRCLDPWPSPVLPSGAVTEPAVAGRHG